MGHYTFFYNKPKRHSGGYWVSIPYGEQCMIEEDMFQNLKWEDEPMEVEIIPKDKLEHLKYKASQAPTSPYMGH